MNGDGALTALLVVRLAFPLILLATSLSVLAIKPALGAIRLHDASSPVAVPSPRRASILSILTLVGLAYFLDGVTLLIHSVISKTWQGIPDHGHLWQSQWSGLEVESVSGLLASGLLASIGLWKDHHKAPIWTTWRPKFWTIVALIGSITELSLVVSTADLYRQKGSFSPTLAKFLSSDRMVGSYGALSMPRNLPTILHTSFLVLRLLLLLPLYPVLAYPRLRYIPSEPYSTAPDVTDAANSTETDPLLPSAETITTDQGSTLAAQPAHSRFDAANTPIPSSSTSANPLPPTLNGIQDANKVRL